MKQFVLSLSWFDWFVFGCITLLCLPCVVLGIGIMSHAEGNLELFVGLLTCLAGLFFAGCFAIVAGINTLLDIFDILSPRREP